MANIYSLQQRKILHIVIIVAIALIIFMGLHSYLIAIISSMILYVLFLKLYNYLTLKRKWNAPFTAILIIILSFVIIVLPFLFLSILLTNKIYYYSTNPEEIIAMLTKLEKYFGVDLQNKNTIRQLVEKGGNAVAGLFSNIVSGALEMFIALTLMYFVLYFTFINKDKLMFVLRRYLPFDNETNEELGDAFEKSVNANVIGQSLISFVQAGLVILGLWIFGFTDIWFWGLISFFCAFIPVLGTPLVWVPMGVMAIAQGNNFGGWGIMIYGAVLVMNIDNVLRMIIGKKMGDIHPLITVVGVIFGLPLFGIVGLVIGPLLISYFLLLVDSYHRRYHKIAVDTPTQV